MARPKRIKIAGRYWNMQYPGEIEDAYGICDYDNHTISIKDGMAPIEEADVLIHESLHALIHSAGICFPDATAEEQIVRSIASGLVGVLADNRTLLAHINKLLQGNK